MDSVTHGLTGWLVARSVPSEEGKKWATAAVVIGSVLPDADNLASLFGSELYVRLHRGISHSFAGVAATSLLAALLLFRFGKWKDLKTLCVFVLLGQFSHVVLDLLNSYGTQVFQPFSDARVSFDLLYVVDLAFTGIVVLGLLLSRFRPFRARAAVFTLAAYVGLAGFLHVRAADAVRNAAESSGVRVVSSWALPALGEMPPGVDFGIARKAEAAMEDLSAPRTDRGGFPLPAGPFAWNGFVDDGSTYLRAEVDPFGGEVVWRERVRRGRDVPEARALRELPDVRTYLWFARFPTVIVSAEEGNTVVTFSDLRFGAGSARRPFVLRVTEKPGLPPRPRWGS